MLKSQTFFNLAFRAFFLFTGNASNQFTNCGNRTALSGSSVRSGLGTVPALHISRRVSQMLLSPLIRWHRIKGVEVSKPRPGQLLCLVPHIQEGRVTGGSDITSAL